MNCKFNPAVRRPSTDEFGDVSKSSGSIPKNCKLVRTSELKSEKFQTLPVEFGRNSNWSGQVRTNCNFVRTSAIQKCKLHPVRRPSTNEFGQFSNSCGRFRTRMNLQNVFSKKESKSSGRIAIASRRVRTSCNFHAVRVDRRSGRVLMNCKLVRTISD